MIKSKPAFPVGINVFIVKDNKLLLGKRKNALKGNAWCLPGGHLEYKELMEHTAARELEEETGLKAQKLTFENIVNDPNNKGGHYIHIGFCADNVQGKPTVREPDKCSEWKWFDLDKLPNKLFGGHSALIKLFVKKRGHFTESDS